MTDDTITHSRRRFVRTGLAGTMLLPVALSPVTARGADLPRLEESDPSATALGYVHDATVVDAATRAGGQNICGNCRFYAASDGGWGPCALFPGKAVATAGWCRGWAAQS